jgi:hypothetical protein
MIARILSRLDSWLSRSKASADAEYVEAFAAYRKALKRGDTRTQHIAWNRLLEAQIARLKAEVPCRGIGWRGSR